jgi:hypothetical protein
MLSTTLRKFRSTSSKDFRNCTPKNYSSARNSELLMLRLALLSRMRSGDDGARTERVAVSVLSFRAEGCLGEVVTVSLADEDGVFAKVVSEPQEHLIELIP